MNRSELINQIRFKKSFLCVGLDTDLKRLPVHLKDNQNAVVEFNRQIIRHTNKFAVSYKINTAFYEEYGHQGWQWMEETRKEIPSDCFVIADAKRGDIGNTSSRYAEAFYERMNCDAITVSPYMGEDSIRPFFEYKDKWVICLALTSNTGSADFQSLKLANGKKLYEQVIETACKWGNPSNLMFVAGATKAEELKSLRQLIPNHFLLVPGIGAQGGDLKQVVENAGNEDVGLLVNASRSIIYASDSPDFGRAAEKESARLQGEMAECLKK